MTDTISCALLPSSFAISRESPEHPDIAELLKAGTEFANKIRPSHLNFFLDVTELKADGVHVYAARQVQDSLSSAQGKVLGMAALVPISADFELGKAAEIKRMCVHTAARGQGIGQALIKFLEKEALKEGYERVMLETGYDFVDARKLYEKLGYKYIERFGAYKRAEQSLCMQIWLKADREDGILVRHFFQARQPLPWLLIILLFFPIDLTACLIPSPPARTNLLQVIESSTHASFISHICW